MKEWVWVHEGGGDIDLTCKLRLALAAVPLLYKQPEICSPA